MKHGMTIGTYGPKILDGIDLVLRSNLRQRNEMMNMRKIDHYFPATNFTHTGFERLTFVPAGVSPPVCGSILNSTMLSES